MGKVNVCLIDDDDWFREMFSQYLMCSCRNISMSSEGFEDWKNGFYEREQKDGNECDLYIFGDAGLEIADQKCAAEIVSKSVFLYRREEDMLQMKEMLPEAELIFKYMSASKIVAHINFLLSERRLGKSLLSQRSTYFVISVTSSCGGAGKTSLSLTMARMFQQKRNKRTLVVSVSLLYDLQKYFFSGSDSRKKTLNEYIYHLFAGDRPELSMDSYLLKDKLGVSTFYTSGGISELCSLNIEEMEIFIDSLSRSEVFDVIILDLDNSNNAVTGLIAEKSDVMIILTLPEQGETQAAREWSANILRNSSAEPDIMRFVINMEGRVKEELKYFDDLGSVQEEVREEIVLRIPYDPQSFYSSEGVRQISTTGAFAASADVLVRDVMPVV